MQCFTFFSKNQADKSKKVKQWRRGREVVASGSASARHKIVRVYFPNNVGRNEWNEPQRAMSETNKRLGLKRPSNRAQNGDPKVRV